MAKPYAALRGLLVANDVSHEQLARKLRICRDSLSRRLNNRHPWLLSECYQILDWLQVDHARLPEFFPAGGRPAS